MAAMCLMFVAVMAVSNVGGLSLTPGLFSFGMGWLAALLKLVLCYGAIEQMRMYPWFWNTILQSDARVLIMSEALGLAGCVISVLLDPFRMGVVILSEVVMNILVAILARDSRPD
ncbi:MAG: hypothetical protein HXY34_10570 [Candidatus Thorarchaeota archaeon]|nr:hypothetical protein [Candidatus Thorarchaeota archaeon]